MARFLVILALVATLGLLPGQQAQAGLTPPFLGLFVKLNEPGGVRFVPIEVGVNRRKSLVIRSPRPLFTWYHFKPPVAVNICPVGKNTCIINRMVPEPTASHEKYFRIDIALASGAKLTPGTQYHITVLTETAAGAIKKWEHLFVYTPRRQNTR